MTREEAILVLDHARPDTPSKDRQFYDDEDLDNALNMAIKTLEQEPCEDAVSRQAVIDMTGLSEWFDSSDSYNEFVVALSDLPPVTPTRKKGKWINKSRKSGCGITFIASECTCCGKKTFFDCDELVYRFCPNCGAEMESEE